MVVPFRSILDGFCAPATCVAEGSNEGDGFSSLFTGADADRVGEATEPDMLRPLSMRLRFEGGMDEPPSGIPRAYEPFWGRLELLAIEVGVWEGDSTGLPLAPIRNIILGAGSGAETFNLSLG